MLSVNSFSRIAKALRRFCSNAAAAGSGKVGGTTGGTTGGGAVSVGAAVPSPGTLKVSGTIDHYKIERINLFTITGQDKLISINNNIRKSINKKGGDTVTVTLYLLTSTEEISEKEILDTFKDAGVLEAFKKLSENEKKEMTGKITSLTSEDKQVKMMLKYIDQLSKRMI